MSHSNSQPKCYKDRPFIVAQFIARPELSCNKRFIGIGIALLYSGGNDKDGSRLAHSMKPFDTPKDQD